LRSPRQRAPPAQSRQFERSSLTYSVKGVRTRLFGRPTLLLAPRASRPEPVVAARGERVDRALGGNQVTESSDGFCPPASLATSGWSWSGAARLDPGLHVATWWGPPRRPSVRFDGSGPYRGHLAFDFDEQSEQFSGFLPPLARRVTGKSGPR